MVLQGRVTIENTSAVRVGEDGSVDYGLPPVRLGGTVVPARVAYVLDGEGSSPSLRVEFEIRDGRPECTGLHVLANDGRGIQTGDLAALPNLARLAEEAFLSLAMRPDDEPDSWRLDPADGARVRLARQDIRTRGDEELKEVAQVYRDNIADRPVEAVEALGYTRRTASRRVEQARAKGYLPPTSRGKKNA